MKKCTIIFCFICIILSFSGCIKADQNVTTTTLSAVTTENTVETTIAVSEKSTVQSTVAATKEITTSEETTTAAVTTTESVSENTTTEPQTTIAETERIKTCTVEIDCRTILDNEDDLKSKAKANVPSDGIILESVIVEMNEGDTVLDVLLRSCEKKGVEVVYMDMPLFNSCYIEGIHGIYEKDCGGASGWMFSVNGEFPQMGANACTVKNGDEIAFRYTCDGGFDIGDR